MAPKLPPPQDYTKTAEWRALWDSAEPEQRAEIESEIIAMIREAYAGHDLLGVVISTTDPNYTAALISLAKQERISIVSAQKSATRDYQVSVRVKFGFVQLEM